MERNGDKVRDGESFYSKDATAVELSDAIKQLQATHRDQRKGYAISLSAGQMDSLTALCDTFLPSVDASHITADPSAAKLYQTSASMAGTPHLVGGLISERLKHPKVWLMRLGLWGLSTWMGTLVLCGRLSVTGKWPYVHRFSDLPLKRREEIIKAWSLSYIHLLRIFAKSIKFLTLLVFFTQINEMEENVSWKAIGYVGPDPKFESRTCSDKSPNHNEELPEERQESYDVKDEVFGPLRRGIIDMTHPREIVADSLRRSGFSVAVCPSKVNYLPSLTIQCDAVVIGSGSGGGVAAGVLAKAGYRVLVLEKGNYCARTNLSLLEGPTMDQMYQGGGLLATDDMSTLILAGSTVGGGSTVNWSASIRTPRHVIKEWSNDHDLELFDSKLYKEAMDVVCERMGVQSGVSEEGFNNAILRKGCEELGFTVENIPRNSPPEHYCGWCCLGCKDGKKQGTAETWLVDLIKSGNGAILPGCEAVEIMHKRKAGSDRSTANGVAFEFEFNGMKELCTVESRVTIVACGALNTPSLLKRSGLKNPNIGKNLHLHPVVMAWGYFPDSGSSEPWPEARKKSYEGGIMTAMSSVVGNFEKSGYGAVIQTPALHPGMFSALMPWLSGLDLKARMCKFSRTAHIFALARDRGSGTALKPDHITYRMDPSDEASLHAGIEKVLRILAAAGAEEIGTHHNDGEVLNVRRASSHEFERFVKVESSRPLKGLSAPICSAHQMGSCRMGTDPETSVVNPMGEAWEVEGLFVADTSVFPTALGVNPMVTVQAIAYCTAKSAVESLRGKNTML